MIQDFFISSLTRISDLAKAKKKSTWASSWSSCRQRYAGTWGRWSRWRRWSRRSSPSWSCINSFEVWHTFTHRTSVTVMSSRRIFFWIRRPEFWNWEILAARNNLFKENTMSLTSVLDTADLQVWIYKYYVSAFFLKYNAKTKNKNKKIWRHKNN